MKFYWRNDHKMERTIFYNNFKGIKLKQLELEEEKEDRRFQITKSKVQIAQMLMKVNLSQTILEEKFLKNDCPMPIGHKAF